MTLRVLEVLATLKRAGAERTAVTLARGLDPARFETRVVSLYDAFPQGFEPELEAAGIPVHHLGKLRGFDPRIFPRLRQLLREFRPHLIHTHSYVMRYAYPVSTAALIHTVHNLASRELDLPGRMLHRWAIRRGVRAVAISREIARSYRALYGVDPAAVIPNGVDLPPATTTDWRAANGFTTDDLLVVSVARLDPQKNPLLLIQAFTRAFASNPRAHLLLAGDGALRDAARRAAGDRVHFLGVRDDIAPLLRAADIFALSSDYEGLPVAVIEAMHAGVPVVATAVGGVPELVAHEASGLLVHPRDLTGLTNALAALARDPDLRHRYGARARERAQAYGAARMVAQYASLFEHAARGAA